MNNSQRLEQAVQASSEKGFHPKHSTLRGVDVLILVYIVVLRFKFLPAAGPLRC